MRPALSYKKLAVFQKIPDERVQKTHQLIQPLVLPLSSLLLAPYEENVKLPPLLSLHLFKYQIGDD